MENKINIIYERDYERLVCDDYRNSPFEKLLVKDSNVSMHQKESQNSCYRNL